MFLLQDEKEVFGNWREVYGFVWWLSDATDRMETTVWDKVTGGFPHKLLWMATGLSESQEEGLLSSYLTACKTPSWQSLTVSLPGDRGQEAGLRDSFLFPLQSRGHQKQTFFLGVSWGLPTVNDLKWPTLGLRLKSPKTC